MMLPNELELAPCPRSLSCNPVWNLSEGQPTGLRVLLQ
jgi:hypothetical protein